MDKWVKKGNIWQLDVGTTVPEVTLNLATIVQPTRKELIPSQDFRGLPPGHYYPPGGALLVLPRERVGRFLRIDIKNNEKQMSLLDHEKNLIRPQKRQKAFGRKPRPTKVIIEMPEDIPIDYIFNPYDGSAIRISAGGKLATPAKVVIENYYERTKSDKIINKFIYTHDWAYHEANAAIRRYDRLYAIDTNTTMHKTNKPLSVSVIFEAKSDIVESGIAMFQARPRWTFISLDVPGNPEIEAWKLLIMKIFPDLDSDLVRRIGIVVDSELGRIESFNLRQEPLMADLFLPPGIELIYATDAAGADQFAVNKLISLCHKLSSEVAKQLRKLEVEDFSSWSPAKLFDQLEI